MYSQQQVILITNRYSDQTGFFRLPSNGVYVRNLRGGLIGRIRSHETGIYYQNQEKNNFFSGTITDTLLKQRILNYLKNYYAQKYTNCSAFANFLFTGKFIECDEKLNLFVVSQHMRPCRKDENISIGDMICVFYAEQKIHKSRYDDFARRKFLKIKKELIKTNAINHSHAQEIIKEVYSPEKLRALALEPFFRSYHFMICVDKHNGQPVWLSQSGRQSPSGINVPFIMTKGGENPYCLDIPILTLIKKRR